MARKVRAVANEQSAPSSPIAKRGSRLDRRRTIADHTLGRGWKRCRPGPTSNKLSTLCMGGEHHGQPPILPFPPGAAGPCDPRPPSAAWKYMSPMAAALCQQMEQDGRRYVVGQVPHHAQTRAAGSAAARSRSGERPRRARAAFRARARIGCSGGARARSRSISMASSSPARSSSAHVRAPRPGPISTMRSPRTGAMQSTMRRMTAGSWRKCWPKRLRTTMARKLDRERKRRPKTSAVRLSRSSERKRRAVIDAGAHDRQSERDVHRMTESVVLDDRQSLIVVHGDDDVGRPQELGA